MATMQLTNIADRQRTYLVRDLLFVALVAITLIFVISAFTTAGPAAAAELDGVIRVTETQGAAQSGTDSAIRATLDSVVATDEPCTGSQVC